MDLARAGNENERLPHHGVPVSRNHAYSRAGRKIGQTRKKETCGRSTLCLTPVESTAVENFSLQLRGNTKYMYSQPEDSITVESITVL